MLFQAKEFLPRKENILPQVEINGMKRANIRDSVAVIELAAELEEGMAKGEEWTELKTVQRLQHLRSKQMHNRFHIFPEAQVTVNKMHTASDIIFWHRFPHGLIHFVPRVRFKNLEMEAFDWLFKKFNQ